MKCRVCGAEAENFDQAKVLGKYDVSYYVCKECGFVETEEPYWLEEAYSDAIADTDIGLVGRNVMLADKVAAIIELCLPEAKTFLDYGGGYGMLVRMLRDAGLPFEWYDKYCTNLFAKGQEKRQAHYDVVTAFELFEHLPRPHEEIAALCELGENVLFTTQLSTTPPPRRVDDWWYYAPETGQHIAFYTEKSLRRLGEAFGRHYVGCGSFHLLSRRVIPRWKLRAAIRFSRVVRRLYRRPGLLASDYFALTGKRI